MKHSDVVNLAAKELGIEQQEAEKAYKSFWEFVKKTIADIPFGEISTEELNKYKTSFNIPELGKLYCREKIYV